MKEIENLLKKWEKEAVEIDKKFHEKDQTECSKIGWIFIEDRLRKCINDLKKLKEGIRESEESFCDCEKPVRDHEYSDCCGRCGDVIKEQNDAERT